MRQENASFAPSELRRWTRHEIDHSIVLAPIDDDAGEVTGAPIVVAGHDISPRGVSFIHLVPLTTKKFVAGVRDSNGTIQSRVLQLAWTRRLEDGRYQSGGEFAQPISVETVEADCQDPSASA